MSEEQNNFPVQLCTDSGSHTEHVGITDIYLSGNGMVTISIVTEESWIQMSPLVAKQLFERLRKVLDDAAAEMIN